jgi:type IV secretory pathway TraG/TraD family ATPase VirD4
MRWSLHAVWIALLLLAISAVASIAGAILRETDDAVRAVFIVEVPATSRAGVGRWIRVCFAIARCRGTMVDSLGQSVRAHAPAIRATCGLLVCWIMGGLFFRVRLSVTRSAAGSARYAFPSELRRMRACTQEAWLPLGYLPPPIFVRNLLRWSPARRVFRSLVGRQVRLPAEDLARHVLIVGLTGAHKTTAVTFPILLEAARQGVSVVALDLKYGETDSLARAAPEWQRHDRDVLIFAPLEPATLRWNPLDRCRTIGDAYQLSALIFDEPDPSDPDLVYWLGAERHVCAVLCFALTVDAGPATLGRLRFLCESGPAAVQGYVKAHPAASVLVPKLGSYQAMLPKDQAGILQGIASRLEAWGDEVVCAATGPSVPRELIDFSRVRREPTLLLVGVPQAALGRLRWLCHFFLRDLAASLLTPRSAEEGVRVLLILEELPAWGMLPGLVDHLATYRSRQVSVVATLQSEAQGEHVYGRDGWSAVAANLVTKLYFRSLADADAERLSRVIGTAAGEDVARSRGWGPAGIRAGEHRRAIPVPLERPETLRGIGSSPEEILVRFPGKPPARLWCPPYYLRPEYLDRLPAGETTTANLAVYHHLRVARAQGETRAAPATRVAPLITLEPALRPQQDAGVTRAGSAALGTPDAHVDHTSLDDIAALNRLVEILSVRIRGDAGSIIKAVRNGGRLVEVRIPPEAVAQACQGADAMHVLGRRWSALRWVRRIRPMFILNKRALEALDPRLLQRLREICDRDPAQPPSPRT